MLKFVEATKYVQVASVANFILGYFRFLLVLMLSAVALKNYHSSTVFCSGDVVVYHRDVVLGSPIWLSFNSLLSQ